MRHSDIFDSYVKIAEEQGLVSLSEDEVKTPSDKPKESAKMKRYKKSPYPRMGSDTIEVIQALYGVKPDNSVEYENNIMEAAHKTPVVIAPAYDRLNALVENNIERNNIMCDIALKQNDSITSMHRYAEKELMLQLVRIANDMDNIGNEDIRVLADACIEKLALKKNSEWYDGLVEKGKEWLGVGTGAGENALIGSAIGGILGGLFGGLPGAWAGIKAGGFIGGGATALIASLTKTAPHVVSISANAKDAMDQMNDLINKLPSDNKERTFLTTFNQILKSTAYFSEQYNELITSLQTNPNNVEDADRSKKIAESLIEATNTVKEYTQKFNQDVKLGIFNEADNHSKILDPLYNMMNTDVEDIQQSLVSLNSAIDQFMSTLHSDVKSTANQVAQAQQGAQDKPASMSSGKNDESERAKQLKEIVQELNVPADKEPQAESWLESLVK
jgi:hypothetical protein